jgi:hypothetical protein
VFHLLRLLIVVGKKRFDGFVNASIHKSITKY